MQPRSSLQILPLLLKDSEDSEEKIGAKLNCSERSAFASRPESHPRFFHANFEGPNARHGGAEWRQLQISLSWYLRFGTFSANGFEQLSSVQNHYDIPFSGLAPRDPYFGLLLIIIPIKLGFIVPYIQQVTGFLNNSILFSKKTQYIHTLKGHTQTPLTTYTFGLPPTQ